MRYGIRSDSTPSGFVVGYTGNGPVPATMERSGKRRKAEDENVEGKDEDLEDKFDSDVEMVDGEHPSHPRAYK